MYANQVIPISRSRRNLGFDLHSFHSNCPEQDENVTPSNPARRPVGGNGSTGDAPGRGNDEQENG